MKVKENLINGKVTVDYCSTHIGHSEVVQLCDPSVPMSTRSAIVSTARQECNVNSSSERYLEESHECNDIEDIPEIDVEEIDNRDMLCEDTADPATTDDVALIEARKQLIILLTEVTGLAKECTDMDTLIAVNHHLKCAVLILHHSNDQPHPSILQSTYSVHPHLTRDKT